MSHARDVFKKGCDMFWDQHGKGNERNFQRNQKKTKTSSRQMAKSILGLQPCRSPVIIWLGLSLNTYLRLNKALFGLPWWLRQKRICLQCGRHGFDPWVGKIPWRRAWQSPLALLPGESQGQRSLAGYSPRICRVRHDWATKNNTKHTRHCLVLYKLQSYKDTKDSVHE